MSEDPKREALQRQGSLNPRPERVSDPLFTEDEFFDPRDLVQVKYEMLRRVRSEEKTVVKACSSFGFSRPSFYQAQAAFEREGLGGLMPKKRGPRSGHKLTEEVMAFVQSEREQDRTLAWSELSEKLKARFSIEVHPRSIERVFKRTKKKPPSQAKFDPSD